MAYQFSKRHRTTFQILAVILILLFFAVVLVPVFGPTIISILTIVAIIFSVAVILAKRAT